MKHCLSWKNAFKINAIIKYLIWMVWSLVFLVFLVQYIVIVICDLTCTGSDELSIVRIKQDTKEDFFCWKPTTNKMYSYNVRILACCKVWLFKPEIQRGGHGSKCIHHLQSKSSVPDCVYALAVLVPFMGCKRPFMKMGGGWKTECIEETRER